jgi:predicted ArsR family transcriptional regulator
MLKLLQEFGVEASTAALAERTGLHENTVRGHLDALVRSGLATRQQSPAAGRGRPAWLYSATAHEPDPTVRDYAGLASALARQITRTSTSPQADGLTAGEEWGRALAARIDRTTAARARWRTVELLADLGFEPQPDAQARTVRLHRCPLLDAARDQPDVVCPVHLGMVRGVLAALGGDPQSATLVPFAEVGACLLHLQARSRPSR